MDRPLDPTVPVATKSGALVLMVVCDQQVDWKPLTAPCRLEIGRDPECDLCVPDPSLSRRHAVIELHAQGATVSDLGSSNGTAVAGEPLEPERPRPLVLDEMIELGSTVLVLRRRQRGAKAEEAPMGRVHALARQAATEPVDVCIVGEPGAGKRRLAHVVAGTAPVTIHEAHALDQEQIATIEGSDDVRLLALVTDTPRALQEALARAIRRRRGRTIFTTRVEPGRLLAERGIERALASACETLTLVVPPLRVCGTELGTIAAEVVEEIGRASDPPRALRLTDAARSWLMARAWVGNLREMRALLERAARLTDDHQIDRAHLDADFGELSREDRERQRILDALTACAGNQTAAARMLRMSRRSLVYRLDKYGIPRPRKS